MSVKGKFNVDVFDCTVHVIITKSIKASVNYHLRRADAETIDYEPSGLFCRPNVERIGNYYIFFHEDDVTSDIINHEKSHLVEAILLDRNITPKNEVRAYLDGYISRMIDSFFKKRKMKIKNKRDNVPC
jgi:hypothetical protein